MNNAEVSQTLLFFQYMCTRAVHALLTKTSQPLPRNNNELSQIFCYAPLHLVQHALSCVYLVLLFSFGREFACTSFLATIVLTR